MAAFGLLCDAGMDCTHLGRNELLQAARKEFGGVMQAVDFALDAALPPESELMVDILADSAQIEGGQNGR